MRMRDICNVLVLNSIFTAGYLSAQLEFDGKVRIIDVSTSMSMYFLLVFG